MSHRAKAENAFEQSQRIDFSPKRKLENEIKIFFLGKKTSKALGEITFSMQIPSPELSLSADDNEIHHNRNFHVTRASK